MGTPGSAPHSLVWQPQHIICGARSLLLRDLLLSCKLGLFTPNKAGDYLPVKWPIDGGRQWAVWGGPAESREQRAGSRAGTVIKPFPAGLSFISSRG